MTDTLEGLKERKDWLLKQLKLTDAAIEKAVKKAAAPTWSPQALPGMPPAPPKPAREPNRYEVDHGEFQAARRERLTKPIEQGGLGVEFVPDDPNTAAFIVITMKRLRDACSDDDELFKLIDSYMHDRWASSLTPPFPLNALGAKTIYTRLLEEIREARPH